MVCTLIIRPQTSASFDRVVHALHALTRAILTSSVQWGFAERPVPSPLCSSCASIHCVILRNDDDRHMGHCPGIRFPAPAVRQNLRNATTDAAPGAPPPARAHGWIDRRITDSWKQSPHMPLQVGGGDVQRAHRAEMRDASAIPAHATQPDA